jgi:hypothetical protein
MFNSDHFAFGKNWASYSSLIGSREVEEAEKGLLKLVVRERLSGGLAALAAERPGVCWPLDASIYTNSDMSSGGARLSDDNLETVRPDIVRFSSSVSPTQARRGPNTAIAKSGVIGFGPGR